MFYSSFIIPRSIGADIFVPVVHVVHNSATSAACGGRPVLVHNGRSPDSMLARHKSWTATQDAASSNQSEWLTGSLSLTRKSMTLPYPQQLPSHRIGSRTGLITPSGNTTGGLTMRQTAQHQTLAHRDLAVQWYQQPALNSLKTVGASASLRQCGISGTTTHASTTNGAGLGADTLVRSVAMCRRSTFSNASNAISERATAVEGIGCKCVECIATCYRDAPQVRVDPEHYRYVGDRNALFTLRNL